MYDTNKLWFALITADNVYLMYSFIEHIQSYGDYLLAPDSSQHTFFGFTHWTLYTNGNQWDSLMVTCLFTVISPHRIPSVHVIGSQ